MDSTTARSMHHRSLRHSARHSLVGTASGLVDQELRVGELANSFDPLSILWAT